MDEYQMQDVLQNLFKEVAIMDAEDVVNTFPTANDILPLVNAHIWTFDTYGIMATNKGLVIRCADGSEFQVTIVQSA